MVLKGVNWIHNAKIRSYGLERSQLGTQNLQKPWFSVKICKNCCFWSKTVVFIKIHKNHSFWSKSAKMRFSVKIHGFSHSCLRLQQGNIYGQTKDHLPRKVTSIFYLLDYIVAAKRQLPLALWPGLKFKEYLWTLLTNLSQNLFFFANPNFHICG